MSSYLLRFYGTRNNRVLGKCPHCRKQAPLCVCRTDFSSFVNPTPPRTRDRCVHYSRSSRNDPNPWARFINIFGSLLHGTLRDTCGRKIRVKTSSPFSFGYPSCEGDLSETIFQLVRSRDRASHDKAYYTSTRDKGPRSLVRALKALDSQELTRFGWFDFDDLFRRAGIPTHTMRHGSVLHFDSFRSDGFIVSSLAFYTGPRCSLCQRLQIAYLRDMSDLKVDNRCKCTHVEDLKYNNFVSKVTRTTDPLHGEIAYVVDFLDVTVHRRYLHSHQSLSIGTYDEVTMNNLTTIRDVDECSSTTLFAKKDSKRKWKNLNACRDRLRRKQRYEKQFQSDILELNSMHVLSSPCVSCFAVPT